MNRKEHLAALAVAASKDMVRIGTEHGIESGAARQAAQLADRALTAAENAGCTRADYDRARRTR
ncbi:hypothetical protein [Streptomyces sp. DH12]|uniref:hypothetical protein n=1 Tax=Streptomyces sp. DH12 TaxID=2857010 RepID=UPI001E292C83|nr:hypothetical protein [Streptomyces sp. DH12]